MKKPLSVKDYLIIFIWLLAVTAIELGVVMIDMPPLMLKIIILGTALAKVVLIALFFMHLKSEKPIFWWIPLVPLVLAFFFVLMLFPDMVYHLTLQLTQRS